MLNRKFLLAFFLLTGAAFCQNYRLDSVAQGPKGPIPNATVAFCTQPANTSTQPCSPLANLCSSLSDIVCTQPNPVTADSLGNYHAYIKSAQGPVTVQLYGPQVASPLVLPDQAVPVSANGGVAAFKQTNVATFYASQFCTTPGTLDQTCVNNILATNLCQQVAGVPCHIILDPLSLTNSTYNLTSSIDFINHASCPANIGCPVNFECLDKTVSIVANGNFVAVLLGSNSRMAGCHLIGSNQPSNVNGNNKGINFSTQSNTWVENNVLEQFSATQILCGGQCTNIHVLNNIIKNGQNEGILFAGSVADSVDNVIAGNLVEGNGCNGIDIEGLRNIVVNNNSRNAGGGFGCVGTGNANGIILLTQTNVNDTVVVGNNLTGNADMGLDAVCTAGQMQDTVITGNDASNNGKSGFRLIYSTGNGTCKGNVIRDNVANFNGQFGIVSLSGGAGTYNQNVLGPNAVAGNTSGPVSSDAVGIQDFGLTMTCSSGGVATTGGATAFTGASTTTCSWAGGWTNGIFPTTAAYKASCAGDGIAAGVPLLQGITAKNANSVNVQTQQATGVNAQFTNIECVGYQ